MVDDNANFRVTYILKYLPMVSDKGGGTLHSFFKK